MSGRGRSRGKKGQDRQNQQDHQGPLPGQRAGQRSGPGNQPFVSAPAPVQSAWGSTPVQSAWQAAPTPAQSAWQAAPPPAQSAWGPAAGPSSSNRPAAQTQQQQRPGQPQQQPRPAQPQQQQWPTQPQPQQRSAQPQQQQTPMQSNISTLQSLQISDQQPSTSSGYRRDNVSNEGKGGPNQRDAGESEASKSDRGSLRGRRRGRSPPEDLILTKPEYLSTKRGESGKTVRLQTNYFRLTKMPKWNIYQYRVDFSPPTEIEGFKNKLIYDQRANFGGYLFDGTMLFLTVHIPNTMEFIAKDDRDDSPIKITVKYTGEVSMLTGPALQILNLILRRSMRTLNLQLVGRNFFDNDPNAIINIPQHRLQLWPGYITSIRQHETDILLCSETTHKVMRTESVYDILRNCQSNNNNNWKIEFQENVLGMIVLTEYNNKTYRVDDIDFTNTPRSTFMWKDREVTYMDYYREKYEKIIRDPNQPLLVQKASEKDIRAGVAKLIVLIPELCRATGLTARMIGNHRLMADVATYTRLAPGARMNRLHAFNRRLQTSAESVAALREWNVGLAQDLVEVQGRRLNSEFILFANNKRIQTNQEADWAREFRNIEMYTSYPLKNWVIIYPNGKAKQIQEFLGVLVRAARGMRYEMAEPHHIRLQDDSPRFYGPSLEDAANRNPQLVMVILSNNNSSLYSTIKKKFCVDRPIPSQVMVSRTITPKPGKDAGSLMTVGTKVAIQINSKLGGAPWMVEVPLSGCMVIGFDVCHDTVNKKKSVGALVATMDMKTSRKYFSSVNNHETGVEMSNYFALDIIKALRCYQGEHNALPERIFIYRDGVGEGQTNHVFDHELKNIRTRLDAFYGGAPYKMVFIIVSKRINTRFFENKDNPKPGTIVDDVVTLPERYDFFLVSQSVRQGTVSPTNYNILYDTMRLPADRLQIFTYKMTHLYYNWTGTLRVPAVCQYAHKLAFLVANFIHQAPNAALEKQLYFL